MSEITTGAKVWYPPAFPAQGRLPAHPALTGQNCRQQDSQERAYHQELCLAAERRVEPPCCKTLHISLFFDGTGNNLNNDVYICREKKQAEHPTNIARLFSATIGQGYAGGVAERHNPELVDMPGSASNKYYKYYIPGVGTPFPEIMDLDYSFSGLAGAAYGEERINWGLLRLIDALQRTLGKDKISNTECRESLEAMSTSMASFGLTGSHNRYEEFSRLLGKLAADLRPVLEPAAPGTPKLLGIKLYVYGFSRGAAAARAFVRWLSELLPEPERAEEKPEQCLAAGGVKVPISVAFLGLLDTVASVGVAHVAPFAEGHMSWADETQELPDEETYGGLIKRCVHLVSSHEQRLCFPLDSIRRSNGQYPANSTEMIYPGMHSDIGGGYPPGDQGKASAKNDGYLLSQVALNDLYCLAFKAGAPLKVPEQNLPKDLIFQQWRIMDIDLLSKFAIAPDLINRFNAWREVTLGLPPAPQNTTDEEAAQYKEVTSSFTLEEAAENQMAWLTAWRIKRYAGGTYKTRRFYRDSAANGQDKDSNPTVRKQSEEAREAAQKAVDDKRKEILRKYPGKDMPEAPLPAGPKDFDASLGQTQLRQAAEEFREDYSGMYRSITGTWAVPLEKLPQHLMFLLNPDDERSEYLQMKSDGDSLVSKLFPVQGEDSNADQPSGLVRALFDDQVHDSRAWFMHSTLGYREPWSSYFRYRMIYFGENCNKALSPLVIAGQVIGLATAVGGVMFIIRRKSLAGKLGGLAGLGALLVVETEIQDLLTGELLPMLPGTEKSRAFTRQPGVVAAQQKNIISEQRLTQVKSVIESGWAEKLQSALSV